MKLNDIYSCRTAKVLYIRSVIKTNIMTLELYTELKKGIEVRLDKADELVNYFPKNEMGLVKMTDEFRAAKKVLILFLMN